MRHNTTPSSQSARMPIMKKAALALSGTLLAIGMVVGFGAFTINETAHSMQNADGTFLEAHEAARIAQEDAKHPMGEALEVYSWAGQRVALNDIDESEYGRFVVKLADNEGARMRLDSAIESGVAGAMYGDLFTMDTLDAIEDHFQPADIDTIEPDYFCYFTGAPDASEMQAVTDELAADEAATKRAALDAEIQPATAVLSATTSIDESETSLQSELDLINIQPVWDKGIKGAKQGRGGKTPLIAVIDSGLAGSAVEANRHDDLDYDNILEGQYFASYPSDVNSTEDEQGHGTFVIGQIIAQHNGTGAAGIAPDARVVPYRVDGYVKRTDGTYATEANGKKTLSIYSSDIAQAINAATATRSGSSSESVDIVSMSVASHSSKFFGTACDDARNAGIILVASAGNEAASMYASNYGSIPNPNDASSPLSFSNATEAAAYLQKAAHYPAAFSSVIGVSSTRTDGAFSEDFSVREASSVFVSAPGDSTEAEKASQGKDGIYGLNFSSPSAYGCLRGTSQSAPMVSALAALAKSVDASLTPAAFEAALKATSRDKGILGYDVYYGWGIIDCNALLASMISLNAPVDEGTIDADGIKWHITDKDSANPYQLVIAPADGESTATLRLGTSYNAEDFNSSTFAPWHEHASLIRSIRVSPGVSASGKLDVAFAGMPECKSIDLSQLDVSAATSFDGMFAQLPKIESLSVNSSWPSSGAKFPAVNTTGVTESVDCLKWTDATNPGVGFTALDSIPSGKLGNYTLGIVHTEVATDPVEATCTSVGYKDGKHCSVCDAVTVEPTEVPMAEHDYQDSVTAPTCTAKGYTTHTCSVCKDSYKDTEVDATGHEWAIESAEWNDDCTHVNVQLNCTHDCGQGAVIGVASSDITATPSADGKSTVYSAEINRDGQKLTVETTVENHDSGDEPGDEPGTDPGDEPGTDPGTDPGEDPGTDPGDEPGSDPGADPGDEPGTDPGDEQGDEPSTDPGDDPVGPPAPSTPEPTIPYNIDDIHSKGFDAKLDTAKLPPSLPSGIFILDITEIIEAIQEDVHEVLAQLVDEDDDEDAVLGGIYDVDLFFQEDGSAAQAPLNGNPGQEFGELTLSFPVDAQYSGWHAYILHHHGDTAASPDEIAGNTTETYAGLVTDGNATITVNKLSSFAVKLKKTAPTAPLEPTPVPTPDTPPEGTPPVVGETPTDGSSGDGNGSNGGDPSPETPLSQTGDNNTSLMSTLLCIALLAAFTMAGSGIAGLTHKISRSSTGAASNATRTAPRSRISRERSRSAKELDSLRSRLKTTLPTIKERNPEVIRLSSPDGDTVIPSLESIKGSLNHIGKNADVPDSEDKVQKA